jgi:hypothetical protein
MLTGQYDSADKPWHNQHDQRQQFDAATHRATGLSVGQIFGCQNALHHHLLNTS